MTMDDKRKLIHELFEFYIEEMYLKKWTIDIKYIYMDDANMVCYPLFEYLSASIRVCNEYLEGAEPDNIAKTLLHEMCHVSLSSINVLLDNKEPTKVLLERATQEMTMCLQKAYLIQTCKIIEKYIPAE